MPKKSYLHDKKIILVREGEWTQCNSSRRNYCAEHSTCQMESRTTDRAMPAMLVCGQPNMPSNWVFWYKQIPRIRQIVSEHSTTIRVPWADLWEKDSETYCTCYWVGSRRSAEPPDLPQRLSMGEAHQSCLFTSISSLQAAATSPAFLPLPLEWGPTPSATLI
jgi:hypothetical protein